MPIAFANVCFEGKSGSGADLLQCRSLTLNRRAARAEECLLSGAKQKSKIEAASSLMTQTGLRSIWLGE